MLCLCVKHVRIEFVHAGSFNKEKLFCISVFSILVADTGNTVNPYSSLFIFYISKGHLWLELCTCVPSLLLSLAIMEGLTLPVGFSAHFRASE